MVKVLDIRGWRFEHIADCSSLESLMDGLRSLDSSLFGRNPVLVLLNSPSKFEIYSDGRNYDRDVLKVGRSRYDKDRLSNILRILSSINRSRDGASSNMLIKWYGKSMHPSAVTQVVQKLRVYGEVSGERTKGIYRYKITDVGIERLRKEGLL